MIIPQQRSVTSRRPRPPTHTKQGFELTWLGANAWWIRFDGTAFLVDPWVSRYRTGTFSPAGQDPDTPVTWDQRRIDEAFDRPAQGILITHGHFDHISDVPFAAARTGASVWGTESHLNLVRSLGLRARCPVDETALVPLQGGETKVFPGFTVQVLRSVHRPFSPDLLGGTPQLRQTVEPPVRCISELGEGGSLNYVITNSAGRRLMVLGSADFGVSDLPRTCPDTVVFPTAGTRVATVVRRFRDLIGIPRTVVASHWDNFDLPLAPPVDAGNVPALREAVRAAMPSARFVQPVPHLPLPL
ncbi:MBL fold metallo-hydrolase [Streptomyces sp. NPDC001594]|uniref:MBL fold metallo-hydrolase n=1 Tax=Streptomyces sp. NPDC001594 TaxID=3364590 RepID=UPI00369506D7